MPSKYRVIQITDGEWYELGDFDRDICCGCGLVRDLEYRLDKGRIKFRARVNQRETAKHRKEHGIKVVKA